MGIQTLLKISRCTNETESVMIIIQMNPKRTDFILIHFLEVGGENVKRNRTLCDLFLGGPLKFEQYWKKKVQNEYVLGIVGSHLF